MLCSLFTLFFRYWPFTQTHATYTSARTKFGTWVHVASARRPLPSKAVRRCMHGMWRRWRSTSASSGRVYARSSGTTWSVIGLWRILGWVGNTSNETGWKDHFSDSETQLSWLIFLWAVIVHIVVYSLPMTLLPWPKQVDRYSRDIHEVDLQFDHVMSHDIDLSSTSTRPAVSCASRAWVVLQVEVNRAWYQIIKECTVRICYSVGLWFSKSYHYNRCIITSDIHSLHSDREHLFTAWAYPWTIDKIPNSMGCRVVFKHFFSLIHRSFFLLWLTDEKENL